MTIKLKLNLVITSPVAPKVWVQFRWWLMTNVVNASKHHHSYCVWQELHQNRRGITLIGCILLKALNRPSSQIPQCIRQISHDVPFHNRNVHLSVTKWCIVEYRAGVLWDLCNRSILYTNHYFFLQTSLVTRDYERAWQAFHFNVKSILMTLWGHNAVGQVMELWLPCYLVLLSIDSKTR